MRQTSRVHNAIFKLCVFPSFSLKTDCVFTQPPWYNLHTTLIILRSKRKRLSCFNTEILAKDENAALRHVIDPPLIDCDKE
jgi:hypothetical protein